MSVCGVQNDKKFVLCSGLFSVYLFIDVQLEFSTFGTSKSSSFCKDLFSWKSFLKKFRIDFDCFFDALGAFFSGFLGRESKLQNETIFSEKPDSETWIW